MTQPAIAHGQRLMPEFVHHHADDACTGKDDLCPLGLEPGDGTPVVSGQPPVALDLAIDLANVERCALYESRVVPGESELDGCQIRDRSTHPDQQVRPFAAMDTRHTG